MKKDKLLPIFFIILNLIIFVILLWFSNSYLGAPIDEGIVVNICLTLGLASILLRLVTSKFSIRILGVIALFFCFSPYLIMPVFGYLDVKRVETIFGQQAEIKYLGFHKRVSEINCSACELKELPPEIGRFTALRHLELNNNELTTLPTSIRNLSSLRSLKLSNNKITVLPSEIGHLKKLQVLDLSHNELTILHPEIVNLTKLRILRISGNNFVEPPLILNELPNLEYVDN